MTRQVGNEIDEFVTEALRNNLLGLPLDLAAINIARGRDTGIPTLNAARREFYEHDPATASSSPTRAGSTSRRTSKHEASVINFIAAYGTHATITDADDAGRQARRGDALVFGDGVDQRRCDDRRTHRADRLDFLNGTGACANGATASPSPASTTSTCGSAAWPRRQMPFGGMLGSTFNFVFETQLEALQNGDRFYYLVAPGGPEFPHRAGEQLVRQAGDARTPTRRTCRPTSSRRRACILEVDQTKQFNDGLGDWPAATTRSTTAPTCMPLVIRDNPATAGADTNYLRYTGDDHVVLGGTDRRRHPDRQHRRRHASRATAATTASKAATATTTSTAAPATTSSPTAAATTSSRATTATTSSTAATAST